MIIAPVPLLKVSKVIVLSHFFKFLNKIFNILFKFNYRRSILPLCKIITKNKNKLYINLYIFVHYIQIYVNNTIQNTDIYNETKPGKEEIHSFF